MSTFKKKINYSTYDFTGNLLLNTSKERSNLCCNTQLPNVCGKNQKKYINTLEKKTLVKDAQIQNDQKLPCCDLRCCQNN